MLEKMTRVGLGCMGMSEFYGSRDDQVSLRVLHAAFELGYRHFDTADMYGQGHNETLLGGFIRQLGARRDDIVVASKAGIRREGPDGMRIRIDNSAGYLREACEQSLRRLGVERIDLYYLHRRDPALPIEEAMTAMRALMEEGKIGAVGLSEVSADTLRRAAKVVPIAALQSEYSLWTRDAERETLDACSEVGAKFIAYSPIGRGFLSGAMGSGTALEDGDLRTKLPRFQPGAVEQNRKLVDALAAFAAELGASPAQVALAWVLARRPDVYVIPGTRQVKYLSDNFASAQLRLTPHQVGTLSRLFSAEAVAGERYPEPLLKTINT
jgi:aryl-alcohol dehydrogenase-like predicted oxidoreductase